MKRRTALQIAAATLIAGSMAFREGAAKASPVLLEPIMRTEVRTPEEYLGAVVGNLQQRRARIAEMRARGAQQVVSATVPLGEMFGYTTELRSLTQGRATSTMEFSHYAPAPTSVVHTVVGNG